MQAIGNRVSSASILDGKPVSLLPLRFIVVGVLSFLLACGLIIAQPAIAATYHYNQQVIATTHLVVLGWILSVIMGAMYQLIPVALETRLYKESLAKWQFWFHLVGFSGMAAMFWVWDLKQVGHFGSIFGWGVLLFVYNLSRTLARIPKWNVIAVGVASSLFWLTTTMFAGLYLTASKCWTFSPFDSIAAMHAHAHLGVIGIFTTLLVGISYKLAPMFAISEIQSQRRAWASLFLLNAGLAGLTPAILLNWTLKPVFALLLAAGVSLYLIELRAIFRSRARKKFDLSLRIFLCGVILLPILSLLGLVLSWPSLPLTRFTGQLENLYGFLALFGVFSLVLVGMLYKIIPFLVWYQAYSSKIGRAKVPALSEMFSEPLQALAFGLTVTGLLTSSFAILLANERLVQFSFATLLLGLLLVLASMIQILRHLVKPRIVPLPRKSAAPILPTTQHLPSHA